MDTRKQTDDCFVCALGFAVGRLNINNPVVVLLTITVNE